MDSFGAIVPSFLYVKTTKKDTTVTKNDAMNLCTDIALVSGLEELFHYFQL